MKPESNNVDISPPIARWEWIVVGTALGMALALGFSNLSAPSLWHDELVHTYVGKNIAETGIAQLPSEVPYNNGTTHNYILAFMIKTFGLSEFTVRAPSVLFAGLNVLLIYLMTRPLLGRNTALFAAVALALSPWAVAWSREARFYTLQQTLYLTVLIAFWQGTQRNTRNAWITCGLIAIVAYTLAVLTSYHSILFLGSIGGFAIFMTIQQREWKSRWTASIAIITVLGLFTLASFSGLMNPSDQNAVITEGGLGGEMADSHRAERVYYFTWLRLNLSTGFFLLLFVGSGFMLYQRGRKGLYAFLAFWVPILILTFLIGYRRPRFMFFAYPMFIVAWAYAIAAITQWIKRSEKSGWQIAIAGILSIALIRIALSFASLTADSFTYAQGANETLARKHPQWREPCLWLKENRQPDTVVLTTTYLPVYYYLGEVDNWYPSRTLSWEASESGQEGLKTLEDLQAYMRDHPRGYFISQYWRFERILGPHIGTELEEDVAWVTQNLTRLDTPSNPDITIYTWGLND